MRPAVFCGVADLPLILLLAERPTAFALLYIYSARARPGAVDDSLDFLSEIRYNPDFDVKQGASFAWRPHRVRVPRSGI